tara:strand:- start:351 stop:602 length:252 start_codon:yes stop_codon:yes gene_type:complete
MDLFLRAYTTTSEIMLPILIFIIILIVRDLGKYSKLSDRISNILREVSDDIEDSGFVKNDREDSISYIRRFIAKKISSSKTPE